MVTAEMRSADVENRGKHPAAEADSCHGNSTTMRERQWECRPFWDCNAAAFGLREREPSKRYFK